MAAILKKNSDGRRHIHNFFKNSYFIFYKYNQGLVFWGISKNFRTIFSIRSNFFLLLFLYFLFFLRGDQIFEGGLGGPPLIIGNPKMGLSGGQYVKTNLAIGLKSKKNLPLCVEFFFRVGDVFALPP